MTNNKITDILEEDSELIDDIDKSEELQIDRIPKTYVLLNNYWDTIDTNLKKNKNKFVRFIAEYRNRNISKLETPYPIDYPPWINKNTSICYDVTGIDEREFIKDCETIRGIDGYKDPYLKDKSINILLNLIYRWFIKNNHTKEAEITRYYIGYSCYWKSFSKYFKVYKPKAEVMQFTINNMTYKNSLKKIGSVDKWLYYGVTASFDTYKKRLERASDWELQYIYDKTRAKFDGYFKQLYRAQEKNQQAGDSIYASKTILDDETRLESESNSATVSSLADSLTSSFFTNPVSEDAIKAAKHNSLSTRDFRNTILCISDNSKNTEDVRALYSAMMYLFIIEGNNTANQIGTTTYYFEMMKLYKPGNTIDKNRAIIKDLLDKWLKIGSGTYRSSRRADTLNKFRKSIYEYFVLRSVFIK